MIPIPENSTFIEMKHPISNNMHQHEVVTLLQPCINTPTEPENTEYTKCPNNISKFTWINFFITSETSETSVLTNST